MVRFCLAVLAICFAVVALNCAVFLTVRAPLGAEYWVRETLIAKRAQAAAVPGPRVLVVGGSSTLFGVDSDKLSETLGRPVYNLGFHASMRLEWLLDEGRRAARSGDTIVLILEPPLYDCHSGHWGNWQLRNAIAWGPEYLAAEPWHRKVHASLTGGSPAMVLELLRARTGRPRQLVSRRRAFLAPEAEILARQKSAGPDAEFAYSATNLSARGDMRHTDGARYKGPPADAALAAGVCPRVGRLLQAFAGEMKAHEVRVLLDYAPYLVEGPNRHWQEADTAFRRDLKKYGLAPVSQRADLFFSRDLFFDTDLHLNATGRAIRSERLGAALKATGAFGG